MEEKIVTDEIQSTSKTVKTSGNGKKWIAIVIGLVSLVVMDILLGIILYNNFISEQNSQNMYEEAFRAWKDEATRVALEEASREEADAALRAEEASRSEAAALAEDKELDAYKSNLEKITRAMVNGSELTETLGKQIQSVWNNSIYKKEDPKTDKFTRPNGVFVDDFNDALHNLFSDASYVADLAKIKEYANDVTNTMKELTNPPKGFEKACDCLIECYGAHMVLYYTVTDPSGNYQEFSDKLDEAIHNFVNKLTVLAVFYDL